MIKPNEYQNMRRYVEGRMSPLESVHFEGEMRTDDFLADAVEGFKSDPNAFDDMPRFSRPSFSWMYVLGALGIAALFVWLPNEHDTTNPPVLTEAAVYSADPLEVEIDIESAQIADIEVGNTIEKIIPEMAAPFAEFEVPIPKSENVNSIVFIEAYMRPIEASEITAYAPKKLKDNMHIVYIQDLKIVSFPEESGLLEKRDFAHGSHLPASFETSAPKSSKLEERLINRMNRKSYAKELESALIDFQNNKYATALSRFKTLDADYGRNVNHDFYEGLCSYQMGSFAKAATLFQRVEDDVIQSFRQEASWYHALSLQAMGQKKEAHRYFTKIYEYNGHYAPMAASRLIGLQ